MGKIKILFYNVDAAGVNYYRTTTPAIAIDKYFSDEFHVDIENKIDFKDPNIVKYLASYDIIHYHRQLINSPNGAKKIINKVKKENPNIKFVLDIDDYWELPPQHPYYLLSKENNMAQKIKQNVALADFVTTTTDLFVETIKKEVTHKNNVIALYNAIDPTIMKQFENNWKPDPDGFVRITYMAGSSHRADVEQLEGVFNVLSNDPKLKNKFKVILAGWDTEGKTTEIKFNQEFAKELSKIGMWNPKMISIVNKTRGDVDAIPNLPDDIKNKYRNNVFLKNERQINSTESVYYYYEQVLTDKLRMVKDENYKQWLLNFERGTYNGYEGNFGRRWTQKANIFATTLDETDIVLAPLYDNKFNKHKSNLKQVEAWTRKLPVVCSDIPPYNVDGKHLENSILIPNQKNARKYWIKYLKKLILDANLRKQIGEGLYNDFKDKYHLKNVTERRINFYKKILKNAEVKVEEMV